MASPPGVTPIPGQAAAVTTGGVPIVVFLGGINGGFITNPAAAADQGLGSAETLYVDAVGNATLAGNGTTFALAPGETWTAIAGQTTQTTVNAASNGHKFSAVSW